MTALCIRAKRNHRFQIVLWKPISNAKRRAANKFFWGVSAVNSRITQGKRDGSTFLRIDENAKDGNFDGSGECVWVGRNF